MPISAGLVKVSLHGAVSSPRPTHINNPLELKVFP